MGRVIGAVPIRLASSSPRATIGSTKHVLTISSPSATLVDRPTIVTGGVRLVTSVREASTYEAISGSMNRGVNAIIGVGTTVTIRPISAAIRPSEG